MTVSGIRFLLTLLVSCFISQGYARPLQIACTVGCDSAVASGVQEAAKSQGLSIELFNLQQNIHHPVDGIIIPGGFDIHPKHYTELFDEKRRREIFELYEKLGDYNDESLKRDEFELGWLGEYFKNPQYQNLPVLGICYGMQILGVSQKIPMIVDLQTELGIPNRMFLWDIITVLKEGRLFEALGKPLERDFRAYEMHHQGLDLAFVKKNSHFFKNVNVTAVSNDGKIIEAIELKNRPAWGVQFHPEHSEKTLNRQIFIHFLKQIQTKSVLNK